jgi:hypothetical protein
MKLSMVLMCIATLLLVGTVNAATKEKDMEIDALGAYTMLSGADGGPDISAFFLMGRGGYFVTKEIQVSAVLLGAYLDTGLADNTTLYAAGVAGKYHFMTDQKGVPYVGAQFLYGVADLGTSANGTIYGALVGYRYEMTR